MFSVCQMNNAQLGRSRTICCPAPPLCIKGKSPRIPRRGAAVKKPFPVKPTGSSATGGCSKCG